VPPPPSDEVARHWGFLRATCSPLSTVSPNPNPNLNLNIDTMTAPQTLYQRNAQCPPTHSGSAETCIPLQFRAPCGLGRVLHSLSPGHLLTHRQQCPALFAVDSLHLYDAQSLVEHSIQSASSVDMSVLYALACCASALVARVVFVACR
jgi:hypothetical protein